MQAALATLDLVTLRTRLGAALTAIDDLMLGKREVYVWHGDVRVQYSEVNKAALAEYVSQIQAAIRAKELGAPVHAPVYLTF